MPTLIGSCSVLFSAIHKRWLTPREILCVQGFPVKPSWTGGRACCSFSSRVSHHVPFSEWPSRGSICEMAGNSMHCNVAGVILLFALTQTMLDPRLFRLLQKGVQLQKDVGGLVRFDCKRKVEGEDGNSCNTDTQHHRSKSTKTTAASASASSSASSGSMGFIKRKDTLTLFFEDWWGTWMSVLFFSRESVVRESKGKLLTIDYRLKDQSVCLRLSVWDQFDAYSGLIQPTKPREHVHCHCSIAYCKCTYAHILQRHQGSKTKSAVVTEQNRTEQHRTEKQSWIMNHII